MAFAPSVRLLPWDTEFFGRPIGRLEAPSPGLVEALEAGLAAARALGLACVYFETPFTGPVAPAAFARRGFHLADVRTVLSRRIGAGDLEDKDTADWVLPNRSGNERPGDAGDFSGGSRPRRDRARRPEVFEALGKGRPGTGPESYYLTAEEYKETAGFPAPGESARLDGRPESGRVEAGSPRTIIAGLDDVVIGPPRDGDDAALIPIAEDTALSSRFRHDPRFGPSEATRLYREWLRRSLHEGYADHVLVARAWAEADHAAGAESSPMDRLEAGSGKATGFLTLRIKDGVPGIDLVGVAAEARGRGIGVRLIRGAAAWAAAHDFDRLDVATQAHNISALALYQKTGFLMRGVSLVYHIWLDEL